MKDEFSEGSQKYLNHVRDLEKALNIPETPQGWSTYLRGHELNFQCHILISPLVLQGAALEA